MNFTVHLKFSCIRRRKISGGNLNVLMYLQLSKLMPITYLFILLLLSRRKLGKKTPGKIVSYFIKYFILQPISNAVTFHDILYITHKFIKDNYILAVTDTSKWYNI